MTSAVAGPKVNVGVLGSTSAVARLAVMPALERSATCHLGATASLSDPGATYRSYEALLGDTSVEAVYVPLPNSLHRTWVERCASAGKHVLCEKPFAPTAPDALAMSAACSGAGVVLMEAYMTRFHPRDAAARRLASSGDLGELLFGAAAFTGVLGRPDDHRWRPEMGGGALLDVGIYCLTPLLASAGVRPDDSSAITAVRAVAHRAHLGVDASFAGWLELANARSLAFQCSFEAPERQEIEIVGTEKAMRLSRAFTPGPGDTTIQLVGRDGSIETVESAGADPYLAMVDHFGAVVRGEAELERTPDESIALQRLVDRLAAAAEDTEAPT